MLFLQDEANRRRCAHTAMDKRMWEKMHGLGFKFEKIFKESFEESYEEAGLEPCEIKMAELYKHRTGKNMVYFGPHGSPSHNQKYSKRRSFDLFHE